jgi:hypothetical protein
MVRKNLQNYTSNAVGDRSSDLPPWATALGALRLLTPWATAVGVPSIFKSFYFFCLTSDGGKLYMKIVAFDEIYNFVVKVFSFEVIFIVK